MRVVPTDIASLAAHTAKNDAPSARDRDLRVIRFCAIALLTIAALAAFSAGRSFLMPIVIAVVLALILAPITSFIERSRLPSGIAAILTVVFFGCLLAGAGSLLYPAMSDWMERIPDVVRSAEQKLQPFKDQLQDIQKASTQIQSITDMGPRPNAKPAPAAASAAPAAGPLSSVLDTAPEVITTAVFILVLTIFFLSLRNNYHARLMMLPRTLQGRLRVARVLRDVRNNVSGYLFVLVCINTGLALVTAAAFAAAGIPDPLFWGFVFGVSSFVPVIGPTSVILAAAFVGFATSDTIVGALMPPAILLILDTIESNFVTPYLLSRRIITSPIAILLAIAFFAWIWGPMATVVAVPVLILFHTVARRVPALSSIATLLSAEDEHRRFRKKPSNGLTTPAMLLARVGSWARPSAWRKAA